MTPSLDDHLRTWLGVWPPASPVEVVGWPSRDEPGWDGKLHRIVGVGSPGGAVLSVPPAHAAAIDALGDDLAAVLTGLPAAVGKPDGLAFSGVFRWCAEPVPTTDLPDAGVWLPVEDERVPPWLRPFGWWAAHFRSARASGADGSSAGDPGVRPSPPPPAPLRSAGEVLVALEDDVCVAGVGRKLHDRFGHELAVVTEEAARGKGLARRLVAQAARRVIDDGAVATYLHADSNVASARVAEASGFPDHGWRILGASV